MNRRLILLLFLSIILLWGNVPPEVNNVTVEQREDGTFLVDIWYDLYDADGDLMQITITSSNNEGESWDYLIQSITGDLGLNISSGNDRHLVWDFGADHPAVLNVPTLVKVRADDRNGSGLFFWSSVPAGEYTWGVDDEILSIDHDYEIMKYNVTNIQYLAYLIEAYAAGIVWLEDEDIYGWYEGDEEYAAGDYLLYDLGLPGNDNYARISSAGNTFQISVPAGYESGDFDNHPVIRVSWMGAHAYAAYYGWRLPTEQEWEKAARGMTGYNYPWGDTFDLSRANIMNSGDPWDNGTTPIGYYNGANGTENSPSVYGCYDMSGNVKDWTHSWYGGSISSLRVLRGGSWNLFYGSTSLRSYYRNRDFANRTNHSFSFRCVRTIERSNYNSMQGGKRK
jgi:formylglycine-generating enzyme required for sulfatase activity